MAAPAFRCGELRPARGQAFRVASVIQVLREMLPARRRGAMSMAIYTSGPNKGFGDLCLEPIACVIRGLVGSWAEVAPKSRTNVKRGQRGAG